MLRARCCNVSLILLSHCSCTDLTPIPTLETTVFSPSLYRTVPYNMLFTITSNNTRNIWQTEC